MNINGFALILTCQLCGEIVASFFELPVPGPIIGMALLFMIMVHRRDVPSRVSGAAHQLLALLGLFYVPAGVGLMLHLSLLGEEWLPILASLILSSILTLIITAKVMSRFSTRQCETQSAAEE